MMKKLIEVSSAEVGYGVGFPFCKKFCGAGVFDGEVIISILPNGKRKCNYDDGETKLHTLAELRKYYLKRLVFIQMKSRIMPIQKVMKMQRSSTSPRLTMTQRSRRKRLPNNGPNFLASKYFKELVKLSLAELKS
jgi:hypothetical protein